MDTRTQQVKDSWNKSKTSKIIAIVLIALVAFLIFTGLLSGGMQRPRESAVMPPIANDRYTEEATATTTNPSSPATNAPAIIPSATLMPTPLPTPIPLPDAVVLDTIDMWDGPGWSFDFIDNLNEGDEPSVIGQYKNCAYLWVKDTKDQYGWLENSSSNIQLNLGCEKIPLGIFQPQNGTMVSRFPMMLDDVGELKISNGTGTGSDVVLILKDVIGNVWGHYIHAGATYTIDHIPDGTYSIYFSTGSQWNGEAFTKDVSHQKFDETISFESYSNQYTIWEITLHPVAGGEATTSDLSPDDFPSLGGD